MRVLVVEDDPNLLSLWHAVFTGADHHCVEAETAEAAKQALLAEDFDLVVLDFYLGRDTGLGVAKAVSRMNGQTRIVVVTGSSTKKTEELAQMVPTAAAVLRKPVDIEHLLEVCETTSREPRGERTA